MRLFLCEKPSQARDIANELGSPQKGEGFITTKQGNVTWAFGHLLELEPPDHYGPQYKRWSVNALPILPEKFDMSARSSSRKQLTIIRNQLKKCSEVVIATDADREGEMIAREILDHCRYKGKVRRLWLSALDPESIRKALAKMKEGRETESLYHAARARSCADWVVGMNMTRAFTCLYQGGKREVLNIGRVQTPTFAMVVERDRAIANFKAKDYFALKATVTGSAGEPFALTYDPKDEAKRIWNKAEAEKLCAEASGTEGPLAVKKERKKSAPPKLFSLSGLQKTASAKWGFSADKTLKVAQALYETHKVTTYPRTDCEFLPNEQEGDVGTILGNLAGLDAFNGLVPDKPQIRSTVFNSKKITAHHAIIPTKMRPNVSKLSADEAKLFLLICRHYIAAVSGDYHYEQTTISMGAAGITFSTVGKVPLEMGWKALFGGAGKGAEGADGEDGGSDTLPPVKDGEQALMQPVEVVGRKTQPPAHYTEGTLIADMKAVAKFITDPEKKKRLKETSGIGTEATRAATIARLRNGDFLKAKGKKIVSTEKSNRLYDLIQKHLPALVDPGETAVWEDGLEDIVGGKAGYDDFMRQIADQTRTYVGTLVKAGDATAKQESIMETDKVSWHPNHEGEAITESDSYWDVPGYGRLFKSTFGREMTLEEYEQVTTDPEGVMLDGFVSRKTDKTYSARLVWDLKQEKVGLKFDDGPKGGPSGGKDTGVTVSIKGADPVPILEHDSFFTAEGFPGRLFKKFCGKEMTAQEYASVINNEEGAMIEGLISKKGSPFNMQIKVNWKATPYPKFDFVTN
jgi:DNA topoisomerase-3